ncbi:hypothetical protein SAMN05428947_101213 [Mucilaginibacter sp. OK283]|jgi:hypothetical protein|nr:hypothetical protein SAMN05428947_101213 [Mucilaginibacter sp. OK283]
MLYVLNKTEITIPLKLQISVKFINYSGTIKLNKKQRIKPVVFSLKSEVETRLFFDLKLSTSGFRLRPCYNCANMVIMLQTV